MKSLSTLILGLVLIAPLDEATGQSDYSAQASECSQRIQQLLHAPLSNAPDFATTHDATKWLEEHLPAPIRARFVEAGGVVSQSLEDWERRGMIHGPFWNLQALSELLIAQSSRFNGVAGCVLNDELGVTREILQDQIFIAFVKKNKSIEKVLTQNGVADPYYMKKLLIYGVILDFAKVAWSDEHLVQIAKFQLAPSGETH